MPLDINGWLRLMHYSGYPYTPAHIPVVIQLAIPIYEGIYFVSPCSMSFD